MSSSPVNPYSGTISPGVVGGLGALGGLAGFFGTPSSGSSTTTNNLNTSQQTIGSQQTSIDSLINFINNLQGTTTTTGTGTTTPTLSPEAQQLVSELTQKYSALTAPSTADYVANQTAGINASANAQSQNVQNIMASRGLSTSPAAATAQANIEQNRINQLTSMKQQAPLLMNQQQLANLAGAASFFSAIPKGTATTQNQQQQQQQQQTGQQETATGANVVNAQSTNTQQQGTQNTVSRANQGGGIGSAIGGGVSTILSLLPFLSDEDTKENVRPVKKATEIIRKLRPTNFRYKDEYGGKESSGFIAQDVQKILPHVVSDIGDKKAINYHEFIPYLIGAIQDIDKRTRGSQRSKSSKEEG